MNRARIKMNIARYLISRKNQAILLKKSFRYLNFFLDT